MWGAALSRNRRRSTLRRMWRIWGDSITSGLKAGALAAVPAAIAWTAVGWVAGVVAVVAWVLPWALSSAWAERPSAYGVRPRGRSGA